MNHKEKFVKYLTEGIPAKIESDDVPRFYEALTDFINEKDNQFFCHHDKTLNEVLVSNVKNDFLRVLYREQKIIFEKVNGWHEGEITDYVNNIAQSFLGVLIFIESIDPSIDTQIIEGLNHDQWIA